MKRRVLSIMLTFAMVLSLIPTTAFAANANSKTENQINYVSLGDSMANGYGLDDNYEHNGYKSYGTDCYPNQFANWLSEEYDATVNHSQFAVAGLRVEDVRFTLELDYEDADVLKFFELIERPGSRPGAGKYWWTDTLSNGMTVEELFNQTFTFSDIYTYDEFINGRYRSVSYSDGKEAPGGMLNVAKVTQDAVKEADIISVGIGNGNFGVYLLEMFSGIVGLFPYYKDYYEGLDAERFTAECGPEVQSLILALKDMLYAELEAFANSYGISVWENELLSELVDMLVHLTLSYAVNYAGMLDAIVELNPNAEIMLVGNMNTFTDMEVTVDGTNLPFTLTDLMNVVVVPVNAYIAALPTMMQALGKEAYQGATFYYSDVPQVECLVREFKQEIYNPNNRTVRDRFIASIAGANGDGIIWGLAGDMLGSMGKLVGLSRKEIEDYEAALDRAIQDGDVTDLVVNYIAPMLSNADAKNKLISLAVYLGVEQAVLNATDVKSLDLAALIKLGDISGLGSIFAPLAGALDPSKPQDEEAMNVAYAVIAAMASQTLTDTVNEMLGAYGVTVGLQVTVGQIKAIAEAKDDAAVAAACQVIADNAAEEIIKKFSYIYKAGVVDAASAGIESLMNGVNSAIPGINLGLNVAGYYESMTGASYNAETDKEALVAKFFEDSQNGYSGLKKYIDDTADANNSFITGEAVLIVISNHATYAPALTELVTAAASINSGNDVLLYATEAYVEGESGLNADIQTMLASQIQNTLPSMVKGYANLLGMLVAMPELFGEAAKTDNTLLSILHIFVRNLLGDGLGAHPTKAGHTELAASIIKSYSTKYTAKDETLNNVTYLAGAAWKYLEDNGYIDAATRFAYRENVDSYYVALGDSAAYGSAADLLAGELGLNEKFANLTFENATAGQTLANMDAYAADIAKADLVTLGFGANGFMNFAAEQVKAAMDGKTLAEMDWVALAGEKVAGAVAAELAKLTDKVAASGIPAQYAGAVSVAIESYAYAYVSHLVDYVKVAETVRMINPEVLLVLVGMYNPMEGVVLTMGEEKLNLGEYLADLIALINGCALGYAIYTPAAIYVEAPNVETSAQAGEVGAINFIMSLVYNAEALDAYVPTAAGYQYIQEQLYNALEPEVMGLMGDVNGDDKVNSKDAMLMLRYDAELIGADELNLNVGDVNGDGVVNSKDAMLVLRYDAELIDKFPAA